MQLEHTLQLYSVLFSCKTAAQAEGARNYIALWMKHNMRQCKKDSIGRSMKRYYAIKDIAMACEKYLEETFK
jgi:hypothetical protein